MPSKKNFSLSNTQLGELVNPKSMRQGVYTTYAASSKIKKDSTTTLALTAAELEASALVIYDQTGAGTPIAPMSTALPSDINAIIILNNTTDGRYIGTISDLTFF